MLHFLLTILLGTPLVFLAVTLFTYAIFWYETANSPYREDLDRLSGGKAKLWVLRGILSSFFSLFPVVLFYPFGFWRRLWHPEPDLTCPAPPVILVHGIYHNAGAWLLYRYWLRRAGFKNIYAFSYESWRPSFDQCLRGLENLVQEVKALFPHMKIILVGHSLGGLLSRACGDLGACRGDIGAIVTLAAPHGGSKMAAIGMGRLVKSLKYDGPVMQRMERTACPSDSVPRLSLYSPVDNMVLPNEALKTSSAGWVQRRIAPVSHVAVLYHGSTAKVVVETLRNIRA